MDLDWWVTLPDGNLYASWDVERPFRIGSTSHLSALLDTVSDLVAANGIGQIFSLSASLDEVLNVWIDVPNGAGWAITYDKRPDRALDCYRRRRCWLVNETVTARYGESWHEIDRICFVDAQRTR